MLTYNSTALDDLGFCNSAICGLEAFIIGIIGVVCFILSFAVCCVAHYNRSRRNSSFVVSEEKYVNSIENGKENTSFDYGYDVTYADKEPQYEEIGRYDKDPTHKEKRPQTSPYAYAESCNISSHSGGQKKQQTASKKTLEYDYVDVNDLEHEYVDVNDMKGNLQRQIVRNSNKRCYINKQFTDDNETNDTANGMSNKIYDNSNVSCDKLTTGLSADDKQNGKKNNERDQFITEMNRKLAQKKIPRNGIQTKDSMNDNGDSNTETDAEYEDASSSIWNMSSPNNNPIPKPKTCNRRHDRCQSDKFDSSNSPKCTINQHALPLDMPSPGPKCTINQHALSLDMPSSGPKCTISQHAFPLDMPVTLQNVQSISMLSLLTCPHSDSNDKRASDASVTYDSDSPDSLNSRQFSDSSDDSYMKMKPQIHQDSGIINVNYNVIKNVIVHKK